MQRNNIFSFSQKEPTGHESEISIISSFLRRHAAAAAAAEEQEESRQAPAGSRQQHHPPGPGGAAAGGGFIWSLFGLYFLMLWHLFMIQLR